jgi:predicted permease
MWGAGSLLPIGRLRDGITLAAAQTELRPAVDRVRKMFPWRMPDEYGASAHAIRYDEALSEGVRAKLFALSAAAMLLLLIACGNVANLLLARAVHREREFAMREALGARQGRLIRQTLTENFVLLGAGGILGAVAAATIVKLLPILLPKETPRLDEVAPDGSLLFVTAASMILTLIGFGAAPLLRTLRASRETLVGRATTPSRRSSRLSFAVVACELALATVLLIGAGLMARTLWHLGVVDSGLHTTRAVTAKISAGPKRCGTVERCWALLEQVNAAVANVPGVRGVNWANAAPLDKAMSAVASDVEGHPRPPGAPAYVIWQAAVTPGYFRTLGIPLLAGRLFTDADRRGALPVLVISESTAKKFWTVETAIGKRMRPMSDREWRTVVGVVGDVAQYALTGFPSWVDGVEYVPLAQVLHYVRQNMELTMIVESSQPESAGTALPAAVRQQVPDVVVARVASLGEIRSASIADQRSTAWLLALLAAVGLSLGFVGVYGVISNVIAQRTREIGIRIAIGATGANVIAMVVRETLLIAAIGCGVGLAGAFVMSRYLESLLFGVTAHDPPAFAVLPIVLLGTALIAAAIPGWRASRTDPAITLREE